jgi:hypothetical protein
MWPATVKLCVRAAGEREAVCEANHHGFGATPHRELQAKADRADKWAPFSRQGLFTLGRSSNAHAEQLNSIFARIMDKYEPGRASA